jgi:hypothetical protein
MQICHILFDSGRFNLSEVKEHFINPCCFGEDVAAWLAAKLTERGIQVRSPYQEDWGWELPVRMPENSYYIGVGGNSAEDRSDPNRGEWRVMITKRRSLAEKITGKNKLTQQERIVEIVASVLQTETGISNVHFEED